MRLTFFKNTVFLLVCVCFSCGSQNQQQETSSTINTNTNETPFSEEIVIHDTMPINTTSFEKVITGAELGQNYIPQLSGKKVGIVANQTSVIIDELVTFVGNEEKIRTVTTHLVDYLRDNSVNITKVFAPEHGFRGTADAGEVIKDGVDIKTGIPIISLYGNNKKPTQKQLSNIDVMIFDIQDVGARFYTYISTLHYVMEACAEAGIPLIVLDRPNPNGHYIDGPILEMQYKSFVGMHPVPVVHGMTIGEYAKMINGEGWLDNKATCNLSIVKMENYTHQTQYSLPINPSPNLPNDIAINLYPSLCFFEGTFVSAGRGTNKQFQIFGAPSLPKSEYTYTFTPQSNEGAKEPKFKGQVCYGKNLTSTPRMNKINLEWLIDAYVANGRKKDFFNDFFTNLAGTKKLQQQIEQGLTNRDIRTTWVKDLQNYDVMREKYLLYER